MIKLCGVSSIKIAIVFVLFAAVLQGSSATCFFSPELQGTFVTQSAVTHEQEVLYSQVNITEYSIPIWGECYKRIDNNIILRIGSEETSCFRCFHLKLLSRNVVRVHVADKDYISKCYTNEAIAIASCPNANISRNSTRNKEIILYKIYEYNGDEIRREYCPFSERYHFTYIVEDETATEPMECLGKDSELDNCPSGSAINLRFRQCSFENREITFECLGQWQGIGQQNYMALVNSQSNTNFGPQYRCAIYFENPNTGIITISLSSDSTCTSIATYSHTNQANLSNQKRNEIFHLYPSEKKSWQSQQDFCQFPDWMHGRWEYVSINSEELMYKDHSSFKTYRMKCLKHETMGSSIAKNTSESKFLVFSRTQCGEEQYHCLSIIRRSTNILEFQIGSKTVQSLAHDGSELSIHGICDAQYFDNSRWITQGRLDHGLSITACPVDGEFEGLIPDAEGLCAKLWSDCHAPDIMYYQISACDNSEVYEEREYQCLGQWHEHDVVYIYTKRRDVGTYECFVGSITGQDIFLKEAGEHCQRDIDPNRYGMQLKQTKYCNSNHHKLNKHPIIGHMNAVTAPTNRPHLSNNFDPVPAFSPMPPVDKTHDLPIIKINDMRVPGIVESTTNRGQQQSTTLTTIQSKSIEHKEMNQQDFNEKAPTTDTNETIQFIVNNNTSPAKDDQQYVVSTVVTGPGSIADTKSKSSATINESDFNRSQCSSRINHLMLLAAMIATLIAGSSLVTICVN